jgi:uncharacterized protein YuzE
MRFHLHRRGGEIAIDVDQNGATVTVESGQAVIILLDDVKMKAAVDHPVRVAAVAHETR